MAGPGIGSRRLAAGAQALTVRGTRGLWRARGWLAAVAAVALAVGLTVGVFSAPGSKTGGPLPTQQTWSGGTRPAASPRSRRVAGTTTGQLTGARRPKDAVPPTRRPARPRLRVVGSNLQLRQLAAARPARVVGYVPGRSKVIKSLDTADRVVYANPDGTRTAMVYGSPVNYRLRNGSWASINMTLVPAGRADKKVTPDRASSSAALTAWTPASASAHPVPADGWRVKASPLAQWFAPTAAAAELVRVELPGGQWAAFGIAGAADVPGAASGNTVSYAGLLPNANAQYEAETGGVAENLVLTSKLAPTRWVFQLSLSAGVRAVAGPSGVIDLDNLKGQVLAELPPGFMTDSAINPQSGDGAYSGGVSLQLGRADGHPAVIMTLDQAWLDAPNRVFPVTVDPSLEYSTQSQGEAAGTTYVESGETGNNSSGPEIKAGTWDGGTNVAESFLDFAGFGGSSSALQNVDVLGVDLDVFNTWSYSCSPRRVDVYPVTSSWTPSGLTSSPGPSTGASVGNASFATGWAEPGEPSPCPAKWEAIPLNAAGVSLVDGWTHGATNDGLAIGASSTDSYAWKKFGSYNLPNGDPFLAVSYITNAASYSLASTRPVTQVTPDNPGSVSIKVTNTGSVSWGSGYEMSYVAVPAADNPGACPNQALTAGTLTAAPALAPNASATMTVSVAAMAVGDYTLYFSMYTGGSSPVAFSCYDPSLAVGMQVANAVAVVNYAYPPSGYVSPSITPQLSVASYTTSGGTWTYSFGVECEPLPGTSCPSGITWSAQSSEAYYTIPSTAPLQWNEPYEWYVNLYDDGTLKYSWGPVSIEAEVPQPLIMSRLGAGGGAVGGAVDPLSGQYTTSATDASVAVAGPPLSIVRTYNSADPRVTGAFGAGWSSVADMKVTPDCSSDCSVVVTLSDGQELRFGYGTSSDGTVTYVPPFGSPYQLTGTSSGWTLLAPAGLSYAFNSSGVISQITSATGLTQTFTSSGAEVTKITDTTSGRALTLTWATPSGATEPHVTQVTISPAVLDQTGTWDYSYSGDDLTQVCSPQGCVGYTYGQNVSHYDQAVLDAGPRSFYPFDEALGASTATDQVTENLGTTNGAYSSSGVSLGSTAGPLDEPSGQGQDAATFNGSGYVTLAPDLVADETDLSVSLWFKTTSDSGVLFAYQPGTIAAGYTSRHQPALYIGDKGELYGEFYNDTLSPIHTSTAVTNGDWNYVVLTGNGDTQSMYLNGTLVGTASGTIDQLNQTVDVAGAGFWSDDWPGVPSGSETGYFTGSMADLAIYPTALTPQEISEQYALHSAISPELTQVTLPAPVSGQAAPVDAQISYDGAADRVSSYTDSNGGLWQISRPVVTGVMANDQSLSQATATVTVDDPAGDAQTYAYNMLTGGQLISFNRGAGTATRVYGYDAAGFLNQVSDEQYNSSTRQFDTEYFTNDVFGNVLSRTWDNTDGCASTGGVCTTYYSYYEATGNPVNPQDGELTAVRDARSSSATDDTYLTSYAYNSAGELTSVTQPDGNQTTYTYSAANTTAAYTPGTGDIAAGLLLSETQPGGATTSYAYYADGDLAQVTSPSKLYTVYTYDAQGRMLTAIQCSDVYSCSGSAGDLTGGLTTSYTWNAVNQPLTVTAPVVTNALTGETHQLVDTYTYNDDGNVTSLTQWDNYGNDTPRVTMYTYDAYGHLASETDPAGDTTLYDYDTCGYLASETDPDGNQSSYTYNTFGEETSDTLTPGVPASVAPTPTDGPTATAAPTASSESAAPVASCESDTASGSSYPSAPASGSGTLGPSGSGTVVETYTYTPDGLLASQTDAMGRTTDYYYDLGQQLIETLTADPNPASDTADPDADTGRVTYYTYDNAGNLATETSEGVSGGADETSTEAAYTFTYNPEDQLTEEVLNSTGLDWTESYSYEPDGEVASQTAGGPGGSTVTDYGYDTAGDLTSQIVDNGSAGNLVTSWTYDQLGQQLSMTDPDGNVTNYSYNTAGNLATVTGPATSVQTYAAQTPTQASPKTSYGYDAFGDETQAEDPDGNVTSYGYDADGRLTSVTQPSYTPPGSSAAISAVTSYAYDPDGNLTSETDPAGDSVCYTYDALGDALTQTYPAASCQSAPGQWSWTYDASGEPLTQTDPTGAVTTATWGYFGEQDTSTQEVATSSGTANQTTSYAYNYLGDPVKVTTPDGITTTSTYNAAGDLSSTTDAYGNTTSYTYNYLGEVSQVTNPDKTSDTDTYDPAGWLTGTAEYGPPPSSGSAPELDSQSYGYNDDGDLTSATDGDGYTYKWVYNPAGQVTSQVQPVSASSSITTDYGYDGAGNETAYTDGNGNTTWTTYNSWNLPQSVIEPPTAAYPTAAEGTWTTSYDADGQPVTQTEPGGVTVTDAYNAAGDLTSQSGSGATATTPTRTFTYDLDNRLTSAATPAGTDDFTWNDAGQLTAATGPSGESSFTYNGDNLVTSATATAGTTSYSYDNDDRLATMTDPATGATLTYSYNADSQVNEISAAEGATQGDIQNYGYNGLHELTGDTLSTAAGATIASEAYSYDNDGNLTAKTTTGLAAAGTTTYSYDEDNRLTSATTGGSTADYGYDNDDDLTDANGVTQTYNARDQVTQTQLGSYTPNTFSYNANGTLSSTDSATYGVFPYTSDAYGEATENGVQDYTYDALGRMIGDSGLVDSHTLTYVGNTSQIASDGTNTYTYTPGGTLTGIGVQGGTKSQGTLALTDTHTDLVGSYAPTSASLTGSTSYDALGNPTTTGTMPTLGYQSDFTEPANALVDMDARWYWPGGQTFTSSDTDNGTPLAAGTDASNYAYTAGNPVNQTDPTGHMDEPGEGAGGGPAFATPDEWSITGAIADGWDDLVDDVGDLFDGGDYAASDYDFSDLSDLSGDDLSDLSDLDDVDWSDLSDLDDVDWSDLSDLSDLDVDIYPGEFADIGYDAGYPAYEAEDVPPAPPPPPADVYSGPDPAPAPDAAHADLPKPTVTEPTDEVEAHADPWADDSGRVIDEEPADARIVEHGTEPANINEPTTAANDDTSAGNTSELTQDSTSQVNQPTAPDTGQAAPATPDEPTAEPATPDAATPDAQTPEPLAIEAGPQPLAIEAGSGPLAIEAGSEPLAIEAGSEAAEGPEAEGSKISRPVRMLIGAIFGAAGGVIIGSMQHQKAGQVAEDGLIGFGSGAVGGIPAGIGTGVGVGATSNFFAGLGMQVVNGHGINPVALGFDTAIGGFTGGVGGGMFASWVPDLTGDLSNGILTVACDVFRKC
jgi:RHS repeat-associated protein